MSAGYPFIRVLLAHEVSLFLKQLTVPRIIKREKVGTHICKLLFLTECHFAYEQEIFNIDFVFRFLLESLK